jgi:hypothetical protein
MSQTFSPSLQFLDEVERTFSVTYPEPFHSFCERYQATDVLRDYPQLVRGKFIYDVASLAEANSKIGIGAWGDYELAIAGTHHPKEGAKFWDNVLPIYIEGGDFYGFDVERLPSDVVVVWSVHCVVHEYPSMASWLAVSPLP